MYERLCFYKQKNKRWPDHILFYRDGVSESQYGMVKIHELQQVKNAVAQVKQEHPNDNCAPEITLLVVVKRHHMRFYPDSSPEDKRSLVAGNVMDTGVVIPHAFNFYLQSHDSAMGAAKPAHYVVLVDDSAYGTSLQNVTNNLCSMGSRAMSAMSVCTPARYADILCDRLRLYMKLVFDKKVDEPEGDALGAYRTDETLWGQRSTGNLNPWHDNVKDIMFYL